MEDKVTPKASLRDRAKDELTEFFVLVAYLYVPLGALLFLKSVIREGAGISYTAWGVAALKALLLAKFMLLGRALRLGERHEHRPLIWPTLYKSLVFLILLLVLTVIEETFVGYIQGRAVADSIIHVAGSTLAQVVATNVIMFLILVPYFAFRCLGEVFGERNLVRLFFVDRSHSRKQT